MLTEGSATPSRTWSGCGRFSRNCCASRWWGGHCAGGSIIYRMTTTSSTRKWRRCSACRSRWCRSRQPARRRSRARRSGGSTRCRRRRSSPSRSAGAGYSIGVRNRIAVDWPTGGATGAGPGGHPAAVRSGGDAEPGEAERFVARRADSCRSGGISSRQSRAAIVFPDGCRSDATLRGEGHLRGTAARAVPAVAGRRAALCRREGASHCHPPSGSTHSCHRITAGSSNGCLRHPSGYRSGRGPGGAGPGPRSALRHG